MIYKWEFERVNGEVRLELASLTGSTSARLITAISQNIVKYRKEYDSLLEHHVNPSPLIVTLAMDQVSAEIFNSLRKAHFPPHRNFIAAHITLFHSLPGDEIDRISDDLAAAASGQRPFDVSTAGVQFLGNGVAIRLDAPILSSLHADLARHWHDWLTPQDRQPFRPHVTVQNKVAPETARRLAAQLEVLPRIAIQAEGLELWTYRGGPWDFVKKVDFAV